MNASPTVIIMPPINDKKLNCGHLGGGFGASVVLVVGVVVGTGVVVGLKNTLNFFLLYYTVSFDSYIDSLLYLLNKLISFFHFMNFHFIS